MKISDKTKSLVGRLSEYSMTVYCLNARIQQVRSKPSLTAISLLADLILGWLVFSWCRSYVVPGPRGESLSDIVFLGMETTVNHLKTLIIWMMENPGGLKLNSVLSQALGNFFLYHIHLWMTYVVLVVPLLTPRVSTLVSLLSVSSLSLQMSIISDIFLLLTLHIHCFYAYARRLFVSQWRGLVALWRLFLGKKYNPLRDRVDTAENTVDQLFLGTIIFTILLFLMPTTATFFCVFFTLKYLATSVNYIVRAVLHVLHWTPSHWSENYL